MIRLIDQVLEGLTYAAMILLFVLLFAGPSLIGAKKEPPAAAQPAAPDGAAVFAKGGCGGCHTLAAANSTGAVGPNLDEAAPTVQSAAAVIRSGSGAMPSFEGRLSDAEIEAVAAFVAGAGTGG